ncbi:MAG: hypothetical protein IPP83_07120 [Flavobacteriales bacterium]|nr:hypothetical protein [Flavobacteriales bacterium]
MLLQVLVLDHLDIANGWMVPYLYPLFLLMLPFELPAWASLPTVPSPAWWMYLQQYTRHARRAHA